MLKAAPPVTDEIFVEPATTLRLPAPEDVLDFIFKTILDIIFPEKPLSVKVVELPPVICFALPYVWEYVADDPEGGVPEVDTVDVVAIVYVTVCPQTLPNPKKTIRAERKLKRSLEENENLLELFVKFRVRIITVILLTKFS